MKNLKRKLKKEIANVFNKGVNKDSIYEMCINFIHENKKELGILDNPIFKDSQSNNRLINIESDIERLKEFTGIDTLN